MYFCRFSLCCTSRVSVVFIAFFLRSVSLPMDRVPQCNIFPVLVAVLYVLLEFLQCARVQTANLTDTCAVQYV